MVKENKPKNLADVVGLPDKQDKENILIIIKNYEKKNPGKLVHTIESARAEMRENGKGEFGLVGKEASRRLIFELPQGLVTKIEEAYPLMFRDKDHFRWFVQNFKPLLIPDKY